MGPMPTDDPPAILWDDPHLIAVVKPAGLLTQGFAGGEPTLEDAVRRLVRPDDPASIYLGTVHRLDRPVTGVVLWARTIKAARRLSARFAGRAIAKTYWAVAEGPRLAGEERWEDWLSGGRLDPDVERDGLKVIGPPLGRVRIVEESTPGAGLAITRARALRGTAPEGLALLELAPETGRTHQLRVQASARGRPVVGDRRYGSGRPFPGGIALHARAIEFEHPTSGQVVRLVAPLPGAWEEAGVVVR